MNITDWPKEERPREKLLLRGAEALSDAELLAIFIRTGVKGKTAVDLAREMLHKLGGVRMLLDARCKDFCCLPGLGTTKYVTLQAALEISRRYLQETIKRVNIINNPKDARLYLTARLRNLQKETLACLFLDNKHRMICYEELFQGSINKTNIYPREIIKKTLAHNAAAIILAHNHTSGVTKPSYADRNMTKELATTLRIIEVDLLDHLVIGEEDIFSFAEASLL